LRENEDFATLLQVLLDLMRF